jgi:hypothetical protein
LFEKLHICSSKNKKSIEYLIVFVTGCVSEFEVHSAIETGTCQSGLFVVVVCGIGVVVEKVVHTSEQIGVLCSRFGQIAVDQRIDSAIISCCYVLGANA